MLFNSLQFLVFFIIVTTIYFTIQHKYRWFLLLASSCYFYMAFVPIYIFILGFTIVIDYFAGIFLENSKGKRKKWFLISSLVANIGVLAVFKYYNFLNDNLSILLNASGYHNPIPHLSILLPIGLSFHTFQAMSYTIEVYRGRQKAERKFGIYALYVMFYPQLVAGPIERPQNLLHQFYEKHEFEIDRIVEGIKQILFGLFKKVVIADRLTIYVDEVYNNVKHYQGFALIIATFFFAIQIYCDFSGYSDMAIGIAKVMGFKLMRNFNKPYFSKSVSEFWSRWHISLSTWFRDFLYISLGGNRVSIPRWYLNLFIVFLISGLWHGANWTFVIWGALNGIYLISEILFQRHIKIAGKVNLGRTGNLFKIIFTFILIDFSWIFFRARTLSDAFYVIKSLFVGLTQTIHLLYDKRVYLVLIIGFFALEYFQRNHDYLPYLKPQKNLSGYLTNVFIYSIFIWSIIVFGDFGNKVFIYFQF